MTTQAGGRPSNLPVLWLKPTWQSCEKPVGAPMTIVLGSSSSSPPSALRSLENSLSRLRGGSAAIFSQHEPSKTLARFLLLTRFFCRRNWSRPNRNCTNGGSPHQLPRCR